MLPQAGGWYVYSRRAFGEYAGFVVGCCDWMMQSTAIAYLSVAFGEFAAGLQPGLTPYVNYIGLACLLFLALLNWLGLRSGSRTQIASSLAKALGLLAFVVACFVISPKAAPAEAASAAAFPAASGGILLGLVLALQAVIVTYDGWYGAIYFVEEDENPSRNLPRSALGGALSCMVIFVLVNVALLHVMSVPQIAGSQVPAADAAMSLFGARGKQFILIISLITAVSTINATILISPRILFGMSRDALLPRWLTSVNRGGTPSTALLLCTIASAALILSGNFEALIAISAFLYVAVYISGFASLVVLRRREPQMARPFRAWGYPWTTWGVLLASAGFLIAAIVGDLKHSLFTLILIVFSYPVYRFLIEKRTRA